MSLKAYSKIACFVTIMALLYIHMQMRIYELAYGGKDKEKIIHELNDSNGALNHQILTLESANNLGSRLLDHNGNLQFMDNERVVMVPTRTKAVNPSWTFFSLPNRG